MAPSAQGISSLPIAMPPLQLTVAETLVPSLLTSFLLFAAFASSSSLFAETSLVTRAFFALLPTLLSIAFVQDQRLLQPFKRVFMLVFRSSDPTADDADAPPEVTRALANARAELSKALLDRWTTRKNLSAMALSPSMALADHRTPRMRRRDAALTSNTSELLSASTSGKSLYDQVKENLTDHVFQKKTEAPIYFMDPTTGLFLKVNAQHKLVFTSSPDASCLFHVARGKTHHWGFLSAIYQRYMGQNFVGRIVVSSKKLAGWESFRVLQRPDGADSGNAATNGDKECSNTIYMILCSSRFGKGMWLAKNRRTSFSSSLGPQSSSNSTSSNVIVGGFSASAAIATGGAQSNGARDNIYLSKNFANALALTYASDLSAFEYLANDNFLSGGRVASTSKTALATPLPVAMGTTFQPPVLMVSERTHVSLPWIEDPSSKKFFELQEKQMTEVISTTIMRCTVREFLELIVNEEDRKKAQESSAPVASGGDDRRLCEWHMHPHFGYIRKLSYRPSAEVSAANENVNGEDALALKTIAIDQYHSCIVNEKTIDKVTFRSKAYMLSTPYSNCSSIETVFEFQDLVDTTTGGPSPVNTPVMQFRCHTGVYFTRPTMFAALVEKGALQGVKRTCDLLLEMARDGRGRNTTSASTSALSTARQNLTGGGAKTSIPPHTLAMEVIKGIITSFGDAKSLHESFPSLPTKLPWNAHVERRPSRQAGALGAATRSSAISSASSGPLVSTSVPFFESAPQQFKLVLEESLGGKISPHLLFDSLLSDECAFFHVVQHHSGNMEVDIGAWRAYNASNVPKSPEIEPSDPSTAAATAASVRLQTFRMPLDGIPAVEIAQVRDFQYHAFVHDEQTGKNRLEFGMKLFVRDLPEGEHYSVRLQPNIVISVLMCLN